MRLVFKGLDNYNAALDMWTDFYLYSEQMEGDRWLVIIQDKDANTPLGEKMRRLSFQSQNPGAWGWQPSDELGEWQVVDGEKLIATVYDDKNAEAIAALPSLLARIRELEDHRK